MSRSFFVDSLLDLSTNTSVKTKERNLTTSQLASCEKGTKDALQRLLNVTVGNDIALRNSDKHTIDYRQLFSATLNRNSLEVSHFDNSK